METHKIGRERGFRIDAHTCAQLVLHRFIVHCFETNRCLFESYNLIFELRSAFKTVLKSNTKESMNEWFKKRISANEATWSDETQLYAKHSCIPSPKHLTKWLVEKKMRSALWGSWKHFLCYEKHAFAFQYQQPAQLISNARKHTHTLGVHTNPLICWSDLACIMQE